MLNEKQIEAKIRITGTAEDDGFSNVENAHPYCSYHRAELEKDSICGCFYCLKIFNPQEIKEWCDGDMTALCPHCGIDSIIGESSGYPITKEFLQEMHNHWFGGNEDDD